MCERTESPSTGFKAAGNDRTARRCYRTLLDTIDDCLFQLDDSERFVAVDDALLEVTEYGREELLDTHVSRLVSAADADRLEVALCDQRRAAETDATTLEAALRSAGGTAVPCEIRLDTFRTDDGRHGSVGVVSEVDERDSRAAPSRRPSGSDSQPSARSRQPPSAQSRSPPSVNSFESTGTVFEAADIGVFVLDESFDVALINSAAEEYFGIDRAAVLGRDKRAVLAETITDRLADPAGFSDTVLRTYDDNSHVERFECHVTPGPNRDERWLEHRSKPIDSGPYAGGRIELYYDVSEQRRRAYQLRRLNEAVRGWLDGTSDEEVADRACRHLLDILDLEINGIYRYDPTSRKLQPIAWSEPADALFDDIPTFAEGEGIAWRVFDSGRPEIYGDVTNDPDVYNPETPVRSEICLPIGDYGVVLIGSESHSAFDDGDLSLAKVVASSLESTFDRLRHQRRLERRKSELETELSEILGRVSDAFYALDESWRFTHVNERAEEFLGYDRDELLGEVVWELFPGGTRSDLIERYREAMETQESVSWERYSETLEIWMEIQAYPSETGLSVYFRDISDRKRREQQLEVSNERLEQFAYAVSHDLQEPLRMVSSYLRLIESRYADELDDDGLEFLEYAVDGADRMSAMIDGLLAYSRVETQGSELEPVDLDAVFDDVQEDLRLCIAEQDADVTVEPLPQVRGDADQLRQVFQNLLSNAIEYSGDEPPRVHISAERDGAEWLVSVRDEGIGMDPDDAEHVFEVFQRLHSHEEHPGTGIGLALCHRIVERHGGDIWVDTEAGEGSTFRLTLPAVENAG